MNALNLTIIINALYALFWRTAAQQEIDYIEESAGELSAYEFKWNIKTKNKFSASFKNNYKPKESKVITPDNFEEFIM